MTPEIDPKGTVLLVEDNPDDVALTLRAFKKNHFMNPVVVAKDGANNRLVVAQDSQHPRLMAPALTTAPFHWIHRPSPLPSLLHARIRHRQALQACRAEPLADGRLHLAFAEPQRAAVAGQYVVLYDDDECLGGGEIETTRHLPEASA